jgi:hypothetical protein
MNYELCKVANTCSQNIQANHKYEGTLAEGFVTSLVFEERQIGVQGFVGYMPSEKAIYAVFRAAINVEAYISVFHISLVPFTMFPECEDCRVSAGYQDGAVSVFPQVLREITRIQTEFPEYQEIRTTGYSMGAGLASITGLVMTNLGYDVKMINFAG